jgi:hypothetical protein
MWYYRFREYISWIILFALLIAIAFYGYRLSTEQTLLRLGTGPQGSVTHQLGQEVKRAVETYSRYQVKLFSRAGSRQNASALLTNTADLAIVVPAALKDRSSLSSLGSLGYGYSHLILPSGLDASAPEDISAITLAVETVDSDDWWLAKDFLSAASLQEAVSLKAMALDSLDEDTGAYVLTHRFDERLQQLFASGNFELSAMSSLGALMVADSLYQFAEFPAGTYTTPASLIPSMSQVTLRTPLTLMVRDSASRELVYRIMGVLKQPRTREALAPFGFDETLLRNNVPSIVRHPAAVEYLHPETIWDLLEDATQWLLEYRWLVLLVLLAVALGIHRWLDSKRFRQQRLLDERDYALKKLMTDVLKIEEAQRAERDWKKLEQHRHDVSVLKKRGIDLALQEGTDVGPGAVIFTQQCNYIADDIDRRLATRQRASVSGAHETGSSK